MNCPKKNRFQSVPIAALCLYRIQRENLVYKNSLCTSHFIMPCRLPDSVHWKTVRNYKTVCSWKVWPSVSNGQQQGVERKALQLVFASQLLRNPTLNQKYNLLYCILYLYILFTNNTRIFIIYVLFCLIIIPPSMPYFIIMSCSVC